MIVSSPSLLSARLSARAVWLAASLVAVASVALAPRCAAASGAVRYLTLDQVLSRTDVVALVQYAKPKVKAVRVAITPKGQEPDQKRWPDFVRRDRRLKVLKVLWLKTGKRPAGVLQVAPGDWRFMLGLHRMYHVEKRRKIPIYHRFRGRAALSQLDKKGGQAIALLRRDKVTGWRVAAALAFLPVSNRWRLGQKGRGVK